MLLTRNVRSRLYHGGGEGDSSFTRGSRSCKRKKEKEIVEQFRSSDETDSCFLLQFPVSSLISISVTENARRDAFSPLAAFNTVCNCRGTALFRVTEYDDSSMDQQSRSARERDTSNKRDIPVTLGAFADDCFQPRGLHNGR